MSDGSYITPGRSKVYWVVTVTTVSNPGATEIRSGVDLTPKLRGLPAFNYPTNTADASDLSSARDKGVRGTTGIGTITLELKRATGTETEYSSMDEGDIGHLVVFRKGIASTQPAFGDTCDVYPVQVNSKNPGNPGRNDVDFEIFEFVATDDPQRDVAVATT
jgi:hypothetical protein